MTGTISPSLVASSHAAGSVPAAGVRPREPRGMLITSRVNFDAGVHAPLASHFASKFNTKIVVFVGRTAVGEKWKQWTNGNVVILNDEELQAKAAITARDWERTQTTAQEIERRYGIIYMRDILHQDKGIAAYYLQHSPGSAFARQVPKAFPFLVALVNTYFEAIEEILQTYPIDCFLTRASGLFNSVAVTIARYRKIPVSWLSHTRSGKQMYWVEGPDHCGRLLKASYPPEASADVPNAAAIVAPPDTASARRASKSDTSLGRLVSDLGRLAIDRVITRGQDLMRGGWPRRLPMAGFVSQYVMRWRVASYLNKRSQADAARIKPGKYVLFLLHLDPEYTSSTLARRFNHTHAVIQQLSLSLPIGYTLAIKEHVIGIGNRSLSFFKDLAHLPNIAFVDYRLRAIDVAADAAAVATVWGTICLEASLIGVPVICFTDFSEYSELRNVRTVRSPTEIPQVVREALRPRSAHEILDVKQDAAQFRDAQLSLSFNLSTLDIDEHGNQNRQKLGMLAPELEDATDRLLMVYRAGGGTAEPLG